MKFRGPKRLRIISAASLLLLLTTLPLALVLLRRPPASDAAFADVALVYTSGLASFGWIGPFAALLAVGLAAWVFMGQRRQIHLRYLGEGSRRRHGLAAYSRSAAIVVGSAGLITGSVLGLFAALTQFRPDLHAHLHLPAVAAPLALTCLIGGGLLYAAGRIGR